MSGSDNLRDDIIFENVHSEYNGRQGLSVCGVRGLTAIGCKFNYTGQDGLMSAPSAGIDFENELGPISDVTDGNQIQDQINLYGAKPMTCLLVVIQLVG